MRDRFLILCACPLIVAALSLVPALGGGDVGADPRLQAEIDGVVASIVDVAGGGDTTAVLEGIRGLEQAAGGDRSILMAQLAIYLAGAEGTERAMGAALLFDHFGFSPGEIVAVIAPRLDVDDPRCRQTYRGLLTTVDRPDGGDPDFGPYVEYLREAGIDPPEPLIEYMYGVAPTLALSALAEVYVKDPAERAWIEAAARDAAGVLGAQRASGAGAGDASPQAEVVELLDRLSRSDRWWVRMFVREFVAAAPSYASPALMDRLRADERTLVREGAKKR